MLSSGTKMTTRDSAMAEGCATRNFVSRNSATFVHRLGLATINLYTKYEVSMFTNYEDMKSDEKCKKWGGLGVRDHPRSSETALHPNFRVGYSTCGWR